MYIVRELLVLIYQIRDLRAKSLQFYSSVHYSIKWLLLSNHHTYFPKKEEVPKGTRSIEFIPSLKEEVSLKTLCLYLIGWNHVTQLPLFVRDTRKSSVFSFVLDRSHCCFQQNWSCISTKERENADWGLKMSLLQVVIFGARYLFIFLLYQNQCIG